MGFVKITQFLFHFLKNPKCATAGHVNPKKPILGKNGDRVPPTHCYGATFGVLRCLNRL